MVRRTLSAGLASLLCSSTIFISTLSAQEPTPRLTQELDSLVADLVRQDQRLGRGRRGEDFRHDLLPIRAQARAQSVNRGSDGVQKPARRALVRIADAPAAGKRTNHRVTEDTETRHTEEDR